MPTCSDKLLWLKYWRNAPDKQLSIIPKDKKTKQLAIKLLNDWINILVKIDKNSSGVSGVKCTIIVFYGEINKWCRNGVKGAQYGIIFLPPLPI